MQAVQFEDLFTQALATAPKEDDNWKSVFKFLSSGEISKADDTVQLRNGLL